MAAGVWLARLGEGPEWLKEKALPGVLGVLSLVFGAALIPLAVGGFKYGGRLTDGTAFLLPSALAIAGLLVLLWVFRKRAALLGWVACLACLSILVNGAYDRNYNVPGNRGAVARLSAQYLAPPGPGQGPGLLPGHALGRLHPHPGPGRQGAPEPQRPGRPLRGHIRPAELWAGGTRRPWP